ncbi:heparinase II/III family protein [Fluviibacterium sp. S390]|uniref:heparinase II/III family protein n=1 Tax=Fluviibacterium sp. S390 TaxID=3415139 RepID=UPI003C7CEDD2
MAGLAGGKAYRVTGIDRLHARLSGPMHRRLALRADPAWAVFGHAARGEALLAGHFGLGEPTPRPGEPIWDIHCDDPLREQGRQAFRWLDDLAALSDPQAQRVACHWVQIWLNRFGKGHGPGWHVVIAAERLNRLLRYMTWLATGMEAVSLAVLERTVARHQRFVQRRLRQVPGGFDGLLAWTHLLTAGACLTQSEALQAKASAALEPLCAKLIDPAGGIPTRNPEVLAELFVALAMAARALDLAELSPGPEHSGALARLAPVVRGLRLGTGGLARFQGGSAGCAVTLDAALSVMPGARGAGPAMPMGYARMARGRSIVLVDVAPPPLAVPGADPHAGALGFEMTSGRRRLIVNCGSGAGFGADWHSAARQTASHSTLILDGQSSCPLEPVGRAARRGAEPPEDVEVELHGETPDAHVVAAHNGYAPGYGLIHVRRLDLDLSGGVLRGEDLLSAVTETEKRRFSGAHDGRGVPYALRFHLHPEVTAQQEDGAGPVHLALPSGERWCFRVEGALSLRLDASVYLDNTRAEPRASRQIVLEGRARDFATTIRWRLEKEGDMPDFLRENPRDGLLDDPAPGRA